MQINQITFQKGWNLVLSFLNKICQTAQYIMCVGAEEIHLKLKTSWEVCNSRKSYGQCN